MATSPTQRSKALLEKEGYTVSIVERWNPHARIRQDLFGFIDLLAIRPGETLAVQTTSYSNLSKRLHKITEHENLGSVREAGWKIECHGWHKKNNRWQCRRLDIS